MTTNRQTTEAPGTDRSVYPMPSFVTLTVRDLTASTRWYEAAGFVVLAAMPGADGSPALVHLRRLRHQDLLLVAGEPAVRASFAAGEDDLDARAAALRGTGTGHVADPVDTPWYSRDLVLRDPDGHEVVLTAPRVAEAAADADWMRTVEGALTDRA
jgi:catechol 2,3-dioxygenase-like lactoylglutathione lyase family enzyme